MSESGPLASRRAGVLLHVSSLPGGTLGPEAYAFVDFLAAAGCSVWQVLPLVPPDEESSPYRALSTMAGHPGLLDRAQPGPEPGDTAYRDWCEREADWLTPYVEYLTVRTVLGGAPCRMGPRCATATRRASPTSSVRRPTWPSGCAASSGASPPVAGAAQLRRGRGVRSSATCRSSSPTTAPTSGPTPSCSSSTRDGQPTARGRRAARLLQRPTGQLWGNPLYDWDGDARRRLRLVGRALRAPRSAASTWSASTTSAASRRTGRSRPTRRPRARPLGARPRAATASTRSRTPLGALPLVAEDLGVITPEVEALRDRLRPARA